MKYKAFCAAFLVLCLLTGCVAQAGEATPKTTPDSELPESTTPTAAFTGKPYQAPELLTSAFHGKKAAEGEVELDVSAVSEGYVAVSAASGSRLKFQVLKDDQTYTYDISSKGEPSVFPLQCGDGSYTFRVMENVVETKYAQMYTQDAQVKLKDEFQPFLRPSDYVPYDKDSKCVKKAAELAKSCGTALDVVGAVYD